MPNVMRNEPHGIMSHAGGPDACHEDTTQTIMLVDDDSRLRNLLKTVLLPLNCDIIGARSGEDALTELLQHKVAVIVLDVNLPGMNGFETAELIRETDDLASTPIIFLTGDATAGSDLQRGYDLGAVDFLVKPVSRHVLYAKVKALLELDRSFARLRRAAADLHQQQLHTARAAETRQREELSFTRRRERLTNIFAEASIDLPSLERTIVSELSDLFDATCVLRLWSAGQGWHDSVSHSTPGCRPQRPEEALTRYLTDQNPPGKQSDGAVIEELTARGERVGVLCMNRPDGTEFSEAEVALFRGAAAAAGLAVSNATLYRIQSEYAAVIQAVGDAILDVGTDGRIRRCNNAATALFGGGRDSLLGHSILGFAIEADRRPFREKLQFALAHHREVPLELTCETNTGRRIDAIVTVSPMGDSADLHAAVVIHDVTEIRQAQEEIRHLATHDPLTGLANRRQLAARLPDIIRHSEESSDTVAVLYLDVNKFKHINDTYGHDVGDDLLLEVATRLRAAVDPGSLVCRVGGDEFVAVLEHLPSADAAEKESNRILGCLQAEPVRCRDAIVHPSISMGGSCLGSPARTPEQLLNQADLAMFEAKKAHAQACVFYSASIGSRHTEEARLRAEISDAIERSELRMVYQPIVDAGTGTLFGIEALVRWRIGHEEVPAAEIISLAEAANRAADLGRWVLEHAFADYRRLDQHDLQLHINLSPGQIQQPQFLDELLAAARSHHVPSSRVCLELTERSFAGGTSPTCTTLDRARELGFVLAIDDFGVEYASMSNLMEVSVDCLKIDRAFIAQIGANKRAQRLVQGQIAVADAIGARLIAEGVETQQQADWLRRAGCDLQQGFLYATPTETVGLAEALAAVSATLRSRSINAETGVP